MRRSTHIEGETELFTTTANLLRVILRGMYGLAARFDVVDRNPITETRKANVEHKPPRAAIPAEFDQIRVAIVAYTAGRPERSGPKPGRLLLPYMHVAAATGLRPNEVLSLLWRADEPG